MTSSSVYLDPSVDSHYRDDDWPHPERKIPGSCGEGFEVDVVAEGLELGNGPTRFSSLVAAPGHGGLTGKQTDFA